MPTLYVENVPDPLYRALKARARQNKSSLASEVIALLAENVPAKAELARRRSLVKRAQALRAQRPGGGPFSSAEEIQREDRAR
jgi:plasmid stability protein